jgi:hypothetical protein
MSYMYNRYGGYMQLEKQVVSLELARKLKELGIKQESLFWWIESSGVSSVVHPLYMNALYYVNAQIFEICGIKNIRDYKAHSTIYAAFTATELGEMLPKAFKTDKENFYKTNYTLQYNLFGQPEYFHLGSPQTDTEDSNITIRALGSAEDSEPDARAKMLIYLIENNLIGNAK